MRAATGLSRSSWPRSSSGSGSPGTDRRSRGWRAWTGSGRSGGSARTTSTSSIRSSEQRSSRSARTVRGSPGCGSTGTSGPNAKPAKLGSRSRALSNGFGSCDQPERLQAICDTFGPEHVQAFFDRWITQIPTPLTDRGSCRRVLVGALDASGRDVPHAGVRRPAPRRGRSSKRWWQDNIAIGRPEEVSMVFARQLRGRPSIATRPGSSRPAPRSGSTSATSTPA